ncbi:hypothetical protein SAMD00019534_051710 [Acytostelium subglobosum LB1]|uniref:hypothetical protein n=1 Tax=Acytostelium subglobosum LB1 TaxID=1410327 RepID=UPI0006451C51|nr:hypothetical protein SAMD00019534_051710 [Acytostelium subglobosum LB1]GAM21996.1 hypothetical protein SAMD00019534_051710 [Acytostelium subglobosum LB1]|eukprot:XP_012755096.1 hypothetical protein SAMD00019534_051710 [Acytostelium subglobosum LB1]
MSDPNNNNFNGGIAVASNNNNNIISNRSKGHSNVKELKRLFESKKVVVLDKLSSLKSSNKYKNQSSNNNSTVTSPSLPSTTPQVTVGFTTTSSSSTGNLATHTTQSKQQQQQQRQTTTSTSTSTLSSSPPTTTTTTSTISLTTSSDKINDDYVYSESELSARERKYYFYVNEAIRKNVPIVPSLAIRRKSLDITHSPIKGSMVHSSPMSSSSSTLRIPQSSSKGKTPTKPTTLSTSTTSTTTTTTTQLNSDTSWIKLRSEPEKKKIDPTSPRATLLQTKSSYDLKPVGLLDFSSAITSPSISISSTKSKEEPTNTGGNKKAPMMSVAVTQDDSSALLSPRKKKDDHHHHHHSSSSGDKHKDKDKDKNKDKDSERSKYFSWAPLRRMRRSSSSIDTSSPLAGTAPSVVVDSPPLTVPSPQIIQSPPRVDISGGGRSSSSNTLRPKTHRHHLSQSSESESGSSTFPQIVVTTNEDTSSSSKRFVSHSITILKKDLERMSLSSPSSPTGSPSSTPSPEPLKPKKLISVAKTMQRVNSEDILIKTARIEPSTSEPSSPVLSPTKADVSSSAIILPRLEAMLHHTRARSSSVGTLLEAAGKYEVGDIPPLKVHVTSLDECLEQISKPFENSASGRCFVLDLANCSLGDDGVQQIAENCTDPIEIADLSWNDITDVGLQTFADLLLKTQSLFTSLSLQGNQIQPPSLQALFDTISQINEKKNYKGFGLNLKETGIENEGAEFIANYVGANRYPPMIGLNLTCASVTDIGMSHISSALVRNTFLTTLILDENYLGDDGACLLAEGLKFNKSLTHLQMRNTDIGERGTIELCNTCKFSTSIALLDLSLNPWQLSGEIALQSLLNTKQMMSKRQKIVVPRVLWKDEGIGEWEDEEVQQILQHFGTEKLVDFLINGLSLSPLIQQDKLFEHFKLDTTHLSKIFQHIVSVDPKLPDNSSHCLKLLVELLPTHLNNHIFLTSFINHLPSLVSIIDRAFKRVDMFFLKLLEFFNLLIRSENIQCFEKLNECSIFAMCLDLLFDFPTNNILHQTVLNLFISTTKCSNFSTFEQNIFKVDYLSKLITFLTLEYDNIPGNRRPNFGHLLEISNLLSKSSTKHPFLTTREWKVYKRDVLDKEMQLQESFLCGFVPDKNLKLDKSLLDKFEKEFKK